ncbi:hypothetical protein [Ornithinimicrobium avium]|uniref:hypothetical protein n=1 Tax=Ornithinimicrobium avium TaxID=2283195 RepID=UPI00192E20BF|nr:hypothetical protein [Ornithinimicrobium avium]
MAETLPLVAGGQPVWWWRGPFFLSLAAALPFVWSVTSLVPWTLARWGTRIGLLVATAAIGLEYSTPSYGWLIDLAALLLAIGGTEACGVSALRHGVLPKPVAWSLICALPLTAVAGFLVFWYLPPALTVGLLISWALAAILVAEHSGTALISRFIRRFWLSGIALRSRSASPAARAVHRWRIWWMPALRSQSYISYVASLVREQEPT